MRRMTVDTATLGADAHRSAAKRAAGTSVADFAADPEEAERERDLFMLNGLIDSGELTDDEVERFGDMLARLVERRQAKLTGAQREWVEGRCEHYGVRTDPSPPKLVPRGREVPTPAVLQNLPKKPPGRR